MPGFEHAICRNRRGNGSLGHDELPALEPIHGVLDRPLRETGLISFSTDNVEKTHGELTARGVEFSQGPTKQEWGMFALFKDIDGNQFVLSSK